MRGIPTFMAARSLARSLDDRQRALLAALVAHPDADALMAEAAGESRRFRGFGHARFDDAEIVLLSSVDYALTHCDSNCTKLCDRILEDWDDLSDEMRSRLSGRIDLAFARDEVGVTVGVANWQAVLDRSMAATPAMR